MTLFHAQIQMAAFESSLFKCQLSPALTLSTAPPSFTATPPQYVEAKEGGSTLLSCSAQGNPKPMISWLREGEELVTNAKYTVRMTAAGWV